MAACRYDNQYLIAAAERRKKNRIRQRERRDYLKAHGICVQCGKADAVPGETLCSECKLMRNQWRSGAGGAKESRALMPVPTQARLIREISERTGICQSDVRRTLTAAAAAITEYMDQFQGFAWSNFGRFEVLDDSVGKSGVRFMPGKTMMRRLCL